MATLVSIEDHPRVGRAIVRREWCASDGDALARAADLLREEETRCRGTLPALLTLWIECDNGTVMKNDAVRRCAQNAGDGAARSGSAAEVFA